MNITNNTPKPFPIATGVTLEPNETRYVRGWAAIADGNPIIAAWIKAGLIAVELVVEMRASTVIEPPPGYEATVSDNVVFKVADEPKPKRRKK